MKKIIYLAFGLVTVSTFSCNKYLDVKPIGQLIPSKVENVENLLNNAATISSFYVDNNSGCFYAFLGDNLTISENQALYEYKSTHPNVDHWAAFKFYYPYTNPTTPQLTWEWGIYSAASLFNIVIDEVANLKGENSDLGKVIVAQAKAGRAWSYLVGALGYGPMYDPLGKNDQKVLPYRTTGSPVIPNPPLSTTGEIMDLAEKDLLDALAATPNLVANPARASKSAVNGLLAQLYMFKRDWTKMSKYANDAWAQAIATKGTADNLIYNLNKFSYEVEPALIVPEGTDVETELELVGEDNLLKQTNNREQLFYRSTPYSYFPYPSEEFISLFDKNTDRRYILFMLKTLGYSVVEGNVRHDDGVRLKYYRDEKMVASQGMTYPELLLIKAEANARLNQLGQALIDLNLLRKYRYSGANTDLPNGGALGQDQLIEEILKERRREMQLGTYQRTFDIKRLALDKGKPWSKSQIIHTIGNKSYKADVISKFFMLEINNPTILANPAWNLQLNNDPYLPGGLN
ncbi:MAG: RagB/SusD family nutrient uptake outer membrane protein [Sphingobacterium sp.]|jgi:hypothetical protein|nr:RagB/SusD family nutrient uptake outer membrane protein [Sphingobacterium sp.]